MTSDFQAMKINADPVAMATALVTCDFQSSMRRRVKRTNSSRHVSTTDNRSGKSTVRLDARCRNAGLVTADRVDAGRVAMPKVMHAGCRSGDLAAKGVKQKFRAQSCS